MRHTDDSIVLSVAHYLIEKGQQLSFPEMVKRGETILVKAFLSKIYQTGEYNNFTERRVSFVEQVRSLRG